MDTHLEQRGDGLALALLSGLVLWASRSRPVSDVPAPSPGVPGGVQLGGSLGQIRVSNAARMGTHQMVKTAFANVQVTFQWQPDTRDKGTKLLKPWNYRLIVRMGHNTVGGWRRADELGFPNTGLFSSEIKGVTTLQQASYGFSAPDDNNQVWDIRVSLQAALPDAILAPTTSYQEVATAEHVGAFQSAAAGVQLGGSLGQISVAQRRIGRLVGLGMR